MVDWVSVEDGLPETKDCNECDEYSDMVLICKREAVVIGYITATMREDGVWYSREGREDHVTHWAYITKSGVFQ